MKFDHQVTPFDQALRDAFWVYSWELASIETTARTDAVSFLLLHFDRVPTRKEVDELLRLTYRYQSYLTVALDFRRWIAKARDL